MPHLSFYFRKILCCFEPLSQVKKKILSRSFMPYLLPFLLAPPTSSRTLGSRGSSHRMYPPPRLVLPSEKDPLYPIPLFPRFPYVPPRLPRLFCTAIGTEATPPTVVRCTSQAKVPPKGCEGTLVV